MKTGDRVRVIGTNLQSQKKYVGKKGIVEGITGLDCWNMFGVLMDGDKCREPFYADELEVIE